MISVNYMGRTGNRMFQYTLARLIASHSNQHLDAVWGEFDFIKVTQPVEGRVVSGQPLILRDSSRIRTDMKYDRPICLQGFFQRSGIYNPYRDETKSFFVLDPVGINYDDIVIHLRLGDYHEEQFRYVISPDWYRSILAMEKFNKLFIVVEEHEKNREYLAYFDDLKPVVVSGTAKHDFNFLRSFDRIVCSNSSFAWWAAFLSDARKIYTFSDWLGIKWPDLAGMKGATPVCGNFAERSGI
jgi:hypothetical protein